MLSPHKSPSRPMLLFSSDPCKLPLLYQIPCDSMIFCSMLIPRLNVAVVLLFLNVECYNLNGDVKLQPPRATKDKEKYHR